MLRDYAYPTDRAFWAVTYDGDVLSVAYDRLAHHWLGRVCYAEANGDGGCWEPFEFLGWTDDWREAQAVSLRLRRVEPLKKEA